MSKRMTDKRMRDVRGSLTDRDWEVISTLTRVRVAQAAQLEKLHFGDVTSRRARQKLGWLVRRQVLVRMGRPVGGPGGGSGGHTYALGAAGQRLAEIRAGRRPGRPWTVGRAFVAHGLAVTEIYVRLVVAEREGKLQLARFVAEPGAWRSFHGPGGARVTLKPDAHAVALVDGYEDHWFFEVDLGTESIPTVTRKLGLYASYWRSGTEQARHEDLFPKVLWLATDEARADVLRRTIQRLPEDARKIFDVTLLCDVASRVLQGAA